MVHILVVDDDAHLRQVVAEYLEAAGHRVQTATNGHEALAHMRHECPDVIVLDLEMPVMDGRAMLRACRGLPEFADLPVIVTSGMQDPVATLADLPVSMYLPKPFDLDELAAALDAAESARKAATDRCTYCDAEGPSRRLRVFSKEQPLGRWQLCDRCWRVLELGFALHHRGRTLDQRLGEPIPVHTVEARAWIGTGLRQLARTSAQ